MATWQREELAYCSNVHPGETLAAVLGVIRGPLAAVRDRRGLDWQNTGLWIPVTVAQALCRDSVARREFFDTLGRAGIRLRTLNGFPYQGFHASRVKEAVYRPDWSEASRLDYTVDLAHLLAAAMGQGGHQQKAGGEGTISTLPLGDRQGWTEGREAAGVDNLCRLVTALDRLHTETGQSIRVCLEMEPDCVIESSDQMARLFQQRLLPVARRHGLTGDTVLRHLGVCYDVCHQAVMFESVAESLTCLRQAGVVVGKLQISSALEVPAPATQADLLAGFREPRYLHQVRTRDLAGMVQGCRDLPAALAGGLPTGQPWRVHYHVPVQAVTLAGGEFQTTRGAIEDLLDVMVAKPDWEPHMEVETYTWKVMPDELRPKDEQGLVGCLVAELNWLEAAMSRRGLLTA